MAMAVLSGDQAIDTQSNVFNWKEDLIITHPPPLLLPLVVVVVVVAWW